MSALACVLELGVLIKYLDYPDVASLKATNADQRDLIIRLGLLFDAAAESGRRHMQHCVTNEYAVLGIVWKSWTIHLLHQLCRTCIKTFGAATYSTRRLSSWLDQCVHDAPTPRMRFDALLLLALTPQPAAPQPR